MWHPGRAVFAVEMLTKKKVLDKSLHKKWTKAHEGKVVLQEWGGCAKMRRSRKGNTFKIHTARAALEFGRLN